MKVRDLLNAGLARIFTQAELDSDVVPAVIEPPPPQPVDCVLSEWSAWAPITEWSACVNGQQSRTEKRTRTVVTPPANGGAPCGPTEETRVITQACVVEPPPVGEIPPVTVLPFPNLANIVMFRKYHNESRYERWQNLEIAKGSAYQLQFHGFNFTTGGTERTLAGTQYDLLIDGVYKQKSASVSGAGGYFLLDATQIPEGWHRVEIFAATGESFVPWFVFVLHGDTAPAHDSMPAITGSYGLGLLGSPLAYSMLPTRYTPRTVPLAPRTFAPFSATLAATELTRENIGPIGSSTVMRPNKSKEGIWSTFNQQNYWWDDVVGTKPRLALLDGPRGVGLIRAPLALLVDRNGGAWFLEPHRFGHLHSDGRVETLVGYRHRNNLPSYWEDPADVELVGDWSRVTGPHQLKEGWGISWMPESLPIDPSAPPIGGEQPHIGNPVVFIADSGNNRVLRVEFDGQDRSQPGLVTEFLTGLADPWSVKCLPGKLYVTERKASRICEYDSTTGALLRVVVQGNSAYGTVDKNRWPQLFVSVDSARLEPCILPEGLDVMDDWLYWGSKATGQIKRVHLSTGAVEVVVYPYLDNNSNFVQIAVSDGTFGPRHTVFCVTWSVNNHGFPLAYPPGSTSQWSFWIYHEGDGKVPQGKVNRSYSNSYGTACAVGKGVLLGGTIQEGLMRWSKALPTDVSPDIAKYQAGGAKSQMLQHHFAYGPGYYGYYGYPLPWGQDDDIDYVLEVNGHVRP